MIKYYCKSKEIYFMNISQEGAALAFCTACAKILPVSVEFTKNMRGKSTFVKHVTIIFNRWTVAEKVCLLTP